MGRGWGGGRRGGGSDILQCRNLVIQSYPYNQCIVSMVKLTHTMVGVGGGGEDNETSV